MPDPERISSSQLLPVVYDELRRLAGRQIRRESPGQTLSPTALVHEAYLRLTARVGDAGSAATPVDTTGATPPAGAPAPSLPRRFWSGKEQFLAAAAESMRRILVDRARRRKALKRGGDRDRQPLVEDQIVVSGLDFDLLALNDALDRFEQLDGPKAALVKMLYFAGLTMDEAAEALAVSRATAERWWAYARAWLYDDLRDRPPPAER